MAAILSLPQCVKCGCYFVCFSVYVHSESVLPVPGGDPRPALLHAYRHVEFWLHPGRALHGLPTVSWGEWGRATGLYYGNPGASTAEHSRTGNTAEAFLWWGWLFFAECNWRLNTCLHTGHVCHSCNNPPNCFNSTKLNTILLSHMKYIEMMNSIDIWYNNEGHWIISFGPQFRNTFFISFPDKLNWQTSSQ